MPTNFLQYLIILLIILLFAREYLPFILEKFGIKVKKNGVHNDQFSALNSRLDVFEGNHLHTIEELIRTIK